VSGRAMAGTLAPLPAAAGWADVPAVKGSDPGVAVLLAPVFCNGYAKGSVSGTRTAFRRRSWRQGLSGPRTVGCVGFRLRRRGGVGKVPAGGAPPKNASSVCVSWRCSCSKEPLKLGLWGRSPPCVFVRFYSS